MEEKFIIIDGAGMLSTAYYGSLPNEIRWEKDEEKKKLHYNKILQTSSGIYTNAIYTMLRVINKIIETQQPTYMAFCFDKSRKTTFRRQMYSEYKAQRGAISEPLRQQMINMQDILRRMGFQVLLDDEYEADDFAGSLVNKFEQEVPIYLYSKDHDYLQLVSQNTKMWLVCNKVDDVKALCLKHGFNFKDLTTPDKVFELSYDLVKAEYGVYPEQITDLKGLQGDSSDNIPGVYGVSSVAPLLISKYGSVENLYTEIEKSIGNKKDEDTLKQSWKEIGITRSPLKALTTEEDKKSGMSAKETALLSKKLATIKKDIPIKQTLSDFCIDIDWVEYSIILDEYEMSSLQ